MNGNTSPGKPKNVKQIRNKHNPNSPTDARSHIDHDIKALEIRFQIKIRELRSKRNLLAPISRLPPELLCRIFAFCRGGSESSVLGNHSFNDSHSTMNSFKRWIVLSWVCQYWRNAALGYAELWSTPLTVSMKWAKEMLSRSKMASLKVATTLDHFAFPSFKKTTRRDIVLLILKQLPRIKELHLARMDGAFATPGDLILAALTDPAPLLDTLDIGLPDEHDKILPEGIFGGHAPCLTSIKLRHCAIPWSSTIFSQNMVCLTVDCGSGVGQSPINGAEHFPVLLDALEKMPALQYLELSGVAVPVSVHPNLMAIPAPSRNIALPSLVHIKLSSQLPLVLNLIGHLTLPSTTTYYLSCHTYSFPDAFSHTCSSYKDSLPFIQSYCGADDTPVRRLELTTSGHNMLSLPGCLFVQLWLHQPPLLPQASSTSPSTFPCSLIRPASLPRPSFFLGQDLSCLGTTPAVSVVQSYWSHMNLTRLREIDLDTPVPASIWLEVFGSLRELEKISVFHEAPRTLIKAMKTNVMDIWKKNGKHKKRVLSGKGKEREKDTPGYEKALAFKNLKELSITCFDFKTAASGGPTPSSSTSTRTNTSVSDDLLLVLRRRFGLTKLKTQSRLLDKLSIEQCELTVDDEDRFDECRKYVKELDFDGYYGDDDEFGDDDEDDDDEDFEDYYDEDEDEDWLWGGGGGGYGEGGTYGGPIWM